MLQKRNLQHQSARPLWDHRSGKLRYEQHHTNKNYPLILIICISDAALNFSYKKLVKTVITVAKKLVHVCRAKGKLYGFILIKNLFKYVNSYNDRPNGKFMECAEWNASRIARWRWERAQPLDRLRKTRAQFYRLFRLSTSFRLYLLCSRILLSMLCPLLLFVLRRSETSRPLSSYSRGISIS